MKNHPGIKRRNGKGRNQNNGTSSQGKAGNTYNISPRDIDGEIRIAITHQQNARAIGTDQITPGNNNKM